MIPRAYPQVPVRAKLTIAPYVLLLVVVLGVLEDQGVLELAPTTPTTTTRPPREAGASPGQAARAEIPAAYLTAYRRAARSCRGLSWTLLAAVSKVESNHGRGWPLRWRSTPGVASGTENYAGAGGPMQFLAPTWARWGHGGDCWDYRHAIPAAARKLCADGVCHGDVRAALWAYNPSRAYAARVLAQARRYQAGGWALMARPAPPPLLPRKGGDSHMPAHRPWLRAGEVAARLHVTPKTVARWARQGRLAHRRTLGGHRRYHPEHIDQLVRARTYPPLS